jgi:hypothetical protein
VTTIGIAVAPMIAWHASSPSSPAPAARRCAALGLDRSMRPSKLVDRAADALVLDAPKRKSTFTEISYTKFLTFPHIPAYSPEARGRSERMFGTLQDRLAKELKLAGLGDIASANRFIRQVYLPAHNARFAKPPAIAESAFVPIADPASLPEILCVEQERIVARDNTVAYAGLRLQLPESRARAHYVKARVKVHQYPDGALAVFHGPRLLARYDVTGRVLAEGNMKLAA